MSKFSRGGKGGGAKSPILQNYRISLCVRMSSVSTFDKNLGFGCGAKI